MPAGMLGLAAMPFGFDGFFWWLMGVGIDWMIVVTEWVAALPGAKAYFGVLDRSAYRIELPDNWNGELVMYAHGYAGEGPLLQAGMSPIRKHLIGLVFAWAVSSYDENGYDPDLGVTNTLALRDYFIKTSGQPTRTYL